MADISRTSAIFIKVERGVQPMLGLDSGLCKGRAARAGHHGSSVALIEVAKYSCGHSIFYEVLIRRDADHTRHLSCRRSKDVGLAFALVDQYSQLHDLDYVLKGMISFPARNND